MRQKTGFTIIELMVVIVIIAVLAVITIVAYNGVASRARTSQTVSAAEQWIKALQIYKTRNNGVLPTATGCLGANYGFGVDNTPTGAGPQCRQDVYGLAENNTLNNDLAKYITNRPSPAFVTASNNATQWVRGIYYTISSGTGYIGVVFDGAKTASSCPKIGSIGAESGNVYSNGNSLCTYSLGSATGY